MSRVVAPNLFGAAGAFVATRTGRDVALRWMLHSSLGLPRRAFRVWAWPGGKLPTERQTTATRRLDAFTTLVTWSPGPLAAAVGISISAPGSVVVRAHSAPDAGGYVADEELVPGPLDVHRMVLVGTPIACLTIVGEVVVHGVSILPLQQFVDSPDWVLVDRVGLPVDDRFAGDYSLDPQGPPGIDRAPADAAIARVAEGTPASFWPLTTDTGRPVAPFTPPDADRLVRQELARLVDGLAKLVSVEPNRARQAEVEVEVPMPAPASIHGRAASPRWNDQSRGSLRPLGAMLLAAGTDPYAALALGFGTTVTHGEVPGAITDPRVFLVTLEHEAETDVGLQGLTFELAGELAAVVARVDGTPPSEPVGVRADAPPAERIRLDRPAQVDGPWLEVVDVSWAAPPRPSAADIIPTGYAVLESIGPGAPQPVLEARPAGGYRTHAVGADTDRVRFTRAGLPEAFPGDPIDVSYAVAGHDWFGRWGAWRSVAHTRVVVAPQVPALRRTEALVGSGGAGPSGSLGVEFAWDWADRTPHTVHVRARMHPAGSPPPAVDGSVHAVGGPPVPDLVVPFTAASPETPPPGVSEIEEERSGDLRVYRVVIPDLHFDLAAHPHVAVTVEVRAAERVRPTVLGAFSAPAVATVTSPIPPPPPFVPAAMQWASLPDPSGRSRATLRWDGPAATWSVYVADETAVARELGIPSPSLDTPAAVRLVPLRSVDFGAARRAFRRVAENLTAPELAVELPRGSRLIHFYGIAPVSSTGAERALPIDANDYLAVATPVLATPETPVIRGRPAGEGVQLEVRVPAGPVAVGHVVVTRVGRRRLAGSPESARAPLITLPATAGSLDGAELVWRVDDPAPPPAWVPHYYSAAAWGAEDRAQGVLAGRSAPSATVEIAARSAVPPDLSGLLIAPAPTPGEHVVSFATSAPLLRTTSGAHRFALTTITGPAAAPEIATRRIGADAITTITGALPDGATAPPLFLHRPDDASPSRVTAVVAGPILAVTAEVADPAGLVSRATENGP